MKGATKDSQIEHALAMWGLLLVALLSLLRSPQVEGASNFHLRNHTGLLFLYDFTEGQKSTEIPTHARDITGRYLLGNLTTSPTTVSWDASRQGMRIPSVSGGVRAESQLSSTGVLSQLSSEFSVELFLVSPNNPVTQNLLVAGFGDWPPGTPYTRCNASNTVSEGGWRISSAIGSVFDIDAVLVVGGEPTCVSISIAISLNSLRHIVIRARAGEFGVVSHGSFTGAAGMPSFSPSLWARHYAPLTLANPHASNGWTGTLYLTAMYDRYLSNDEIAANRNFGPPNSIPTTVSAITVPEDATTTLYP